MRRRGGSFSTGDNHNWWFACISWRVAHSDRRMYTRYAQPRHHHDQIMSCIPFRFPEYFSLASCFFLPLAHPTHNERGTWLGLGSEKRGRDGRRGWCIMRRRHEDDFLLFLMMVTDKKNENERDEKSAWGDHQLMPFNLISFRLKSSFSSNLNGHDVNHKNLYSLRSFRERERVMNPWVSLTIRREREREWHEFFSWSDSRTLEAFSDDQRL